MATNVCLWRGGGHQIRGRKKSAIGGGCWPFFLADWLIGWLVFSFWLISSLWSVLAILATFWSFWSLFGHFSVTLGIFFFKPIWQSLAGCSNLALTNPLLDLGHFTPIQPFLEFVTFFRAIGLSGPSAFQGLSLQFFLSILRHFFCAKDLFLYSPPLLGTAC